MMRAIFRPATALVGRLRYAHRFLAIGLVLMVPLGLVAQAYVALRQDQIAFGVKERMGVEVLLPLVELTAAVVAVRHEGVDLDTRQRVDLAEPVAEVDALDERYGEALGMSARWAQAKSLLARLQGADTPRAKFDRGNAATSALIELIEHVGDQSNLTLDPELGTYELIDALQFRLPILLDTSGRIVDRALLARRDLTVDRTSVTIDLGLDNGVLSSTRDAIVTGLASGAAGGDSDELARLTGDLADATQVLVRQAGAATSARRLQALQPEAAEAVQVEALRLARDVAAELDRLLALRIANLSRGARQVQVLSLLAALLAVYLFVGFYLSVSTPMRRMVETLRAVADGDLDARVVLEADDELSFVGRVLNETLATTRTATERLAHQATHDVLTGLPNRAVVLERIGEALAVARGRQQVGVFFLDLDRFKIVNDSMGHEAGDALLRSVAGRLCAAARAADTVGRLAGDEFVVVCPAFEHAEEAELVAEQLVRAVGEPTLLPDAGGVGVRELKVGASVGIALAAGSGVVPDELLRDADVAMYEAKQRGRGRIVVFDEALRVGVQRRLDTREDLRRAIGTDCLCVHYQPILDLRSGAAVGVEALVRWQHPERGMLPPGEFIPIAEDSGLIVPLGAWVLREACRQVARWRRESPDSADLHVAVNLSARQLADASLVRTVAAVLADTGLEPDALWLEITESTIMADAEAASGALADLRRLGVHLAIDDFGTGYSSLAYLRRFPVEALKIDRSFVQELGNDEGEAVVRLVTSLAHALGLRVIAEGVETADQLLDLRRLGCQLVQGYYVGPPLPPDEAWGALRTGPRLGAAAPR